MRHRTTNRFWRSYDQLPTEIRQSADRSYDLLRENSSHPSLHFKKVGGYWSARIGMGYRAIAIQDGEDFIWVWIGTHAEYDELLR